MAAPAHALLVPYAAEGHIAGLLRLAHCLAPHLSVTFAFPARSHALAHLRNQLPPFHPSLRIEIIPDGLSTSPHHHPSPDERMASRRFMQPALRLLIQTLSLEPLPISCIISDTFVPWTQDLANQAGLPRVEFWPSNATVYSMGFHLPELISRGYLPFKGGENPWHSDSVASVDFIRGLPPFPITDLPLEFLLEDHSNLKFQFMVQAFSRAREADTILVHSLHELESAAFDGLQPDGLKIYAVGPLFAPVTTDAQSEAGDATCLKWLHKQTASSVVYVSLGTIASLTSEETHAMALGLEDAGHPFLWVIRADSVKGELTEILPEGFLQRTAGRGMIISWAPQLRVLEHESVAAFFTHCGWNSTLESLWAGVPMVVCPRGAEQRLNARSIVEKWKVGVAMERKEDGRFDREAVETAVKAVMKDHGSKERAKELKQVARRSVAQGGLSHKSFLTFVQHVRQLGLKELVDEDEKSRPRFLNLLSG